MKRFFLLAGFCILPALSWAWIGFGGGDDYSRDSGNEFYCASTGTVTTQAGVSISSPTWSLYNPFNSGKKLVVLDVGVAVMASPAAAAQFVLAYNVVASSGVWVDTNSLTNINGSTATITSVNIGTVLTSSITYPNPPAGKCNLLGILPATPKAFRYIGGTTGASAISGLVLTDRTNGKVVILPGGLLSLQASSAALIQSHVLWREDNL